jgi:diacylglycerol kinase (ATP)
VSGAPAKRAKGVRRLIDATGYSLAGLVAAFRHEEAFRLEVMAAVVLAPAGLWLGNSGVERVLLAGSVLLVLVVELLNSAVEAAVDRISLEHHDLAKRAKDYGSAAVMLSLGTAGAVWLALLIPRLA